MCGASPSGGTESAWPRSSPAGSGSGTPTAAGTLPSREGSCARSRGTRGCPGLRADGRRIATASWDRSVRLWDPASGRLLQELEGPVGALTCVAFSPDGRLAAAGRDRAVTVWDATGRVRQTLSGHQRVVLALAFSRDGNAWPRRARIVSSGSETTSAGLTLKESLEFQGFIYSLAFSPDDTQLAVAIGAGTVAIREMGAGRSEAALKLARRAERVTGLAYSPDGRHLAFGTESEGLQVWDPLTGRRIRAINGHDGEVLAVAYSPDGRHLASGGKDRTVRIWDAAGDAAASPRRRRRRGPRPGLQPRRPPPRRHQRRQDREGVGPGWRSTARPRSGDEDRSLTSSRPCVPRSRLSPPRSPPGSRWRRSPDRQGVTRPVHRIGAIRPPCALFRTCVFSASTPDFEKETAHEAPAQHAPTPGFPPAEPSSSAG